MMKKYWLLLFAITPIGIGYLHNYLFLNSYSNALHTIFSVIFIIYWFIVGYISPKFTKSAKEGLLLTNSFAIICIVLIIIQEVIVGRYFLNIFGMAPQMFYLSTIQISTILENKVLFFVTTHYMWMTCLLSFVVMILIYFAGWKVGSKR
jgi:hypothetical protein